MKRTHARTLIVLALIGAVAGFLTQLVLASVSQPKLRPEYTFAITLVFIAIIVIALAIPVRRVTRSEVRRHVDPFYATRVVMLAKASSLGGALLTGFGVGLFVELAVRSGSPSSDAYLRVGATIGASLLVLIAGLVAEYLCTVPPDDEQKPPPGAGVQSSPR
jgi:hypothetical protein